MAVRVLMCIPRELNVSFKVLFWMQVSFYLRLYSGVSFKSSCLSISGIFSRMIMSLSEVTWSQNSATESL